MEDLKELKKMVKNYQSKMKNRSAYTAERDEAKNIYAPSRYDSASDLFQFSYCLPEYQREYTWGKEKEVVQLLESVKNGMYQIGKDYYVYSLGDMIILKERLLDEDGDEYIKRSLIDGQQRFTTEIITLITIRDLLQSMSFINSEKSDKILKYIKKIQRYLAHNEDNGEGVTSIQYVLNIPTRVEYDSFLKRLISDIGITSNFAALKKEYEQSDDQSIASVLANLKVINGFIAQSTRGLDADDKSCIAEYYMSFADYILQNLIHGIVELSNPEKARQAYYIKNFTGQHLSPYEGFKYIMVTKMPEEYHEEYAKLWDKLKQKYKKYAKDKVNGMGFLSVARSNFKGKYTKLPGGHGSSKEMTVYDAVRRNVELNDIDFMRDMERLDRYFSIIANYKNNPYFTERTKRNIHFLSMTSVTLKWWSVLTVPFDIFGEEIALKNIERYSDSLVNLILLFLTGKDTVNSSVLDDTLDAIICETYRRSKDSPFIDVNDMLTYFDALTKRFYKQKDGNSINQEKFKQAWGLNCNNKQLKFGVYLAYEYISDPAGFYYRIHKDINFQPESILDKLGANIDSDYYFTESQTRWESALFDYNKIYNYPAYKQKSSLTIAEFKEIVEGAMLPICPVTANLWIRTIGSKSDVDTRKGIEEFSESMCNKFMEYLNIPK